VEQRIQDIDVRVYRLDRWNAGYQRGERNLTIPVEASADGTTLSVYLSDVANWDAPDEDVSLTAEDREEIRGRFTEEYRRRGVTVDFDPAQ
jgi:hypothetical protein